MEEADDNFKKKTSKKNCIKNKDHSLNFCPRVEISPTCLLIMLLIRNRS